MRRGTLALTLAPLLIGCDVIVCTVAGCSDDRVASSSSSGSTSSASTGTGAMNSLALPQFVRGAARVNPLFTASAPIVIGVTGAMPSSVDLTIDGASVPVVAEADRFIAHVDTSTLTEGAHAVVARASDSAASITGSLVVAKSSLRFTEFGKDGPGYSGHLEHDTAGDAILHTWVSVVKGKHQLSLSHLDGAFARIDGDDLALNDPADEPLNGYTALGANGLGVVYRTPKAGDNHWAVKLRAVDTTGKVIVPTRDLTGSGAAFSMEQVGVDPAGFSAAWLHITPATDPNHPPPVEIRFARTTVAGEQQGPITLDMDQPEGAPNAGAQILEPLAEIGIACNAAICLVSYTRDHYDSFVQLNVPKLYIATIDLASGTMMGSPAPVEATNWDTQMFGHHLIALADGSFVLVYTANDTAAAVTPKSPCDDMLERDRLFAVSITSTGKIGTPRGIFDEEGSREFPRVAPHPKGFALFWEDQRSECKANGHIRMTANLAPANFLGLLDPYVELPGSVGLPPEDPTLALIGTNVALEWSDNRDGMGLTDPKNEIFLDTYWHD